MERQHNKSLNGDKRLHAYAIGLAIGDGNLSNPNRRAVRLRITCDLKYPNLINKIFLSLKRLFPDNRVSTVRNKGNYLNISVYSNHLEPLLGWKAAGGSKYRQNVQVPEWILEQKRYVIPCLRGLIETDGAIYLDRGYRMVIFSTIIQELARQTYSMMALLGFNANLYTLAQKPPNAPFKYQVRLSKNVNNFLRIVRPLKM